MYEGERARTGDNDVLGKLMISGIPPAPRGVPQIEVTLDVDANGVLNLSASNRTTGEPSRLTVTIDKDQLSKQEFERMVAEAEMYKTEDEATRARTAAKNSLEAYIYNLQYSINDEKLASGLEPADKRELEDATQETISWLDDSQDASKEEYEEKQEELEGIANHVTEGCGSTLAVPSVPSPAR